MILNHLIFIPDGIRFCFVNDYGAALLLAFACLVILIGFWVLRCLVVNSLEFVAFI